MNKSVVLSIVVCFAALTACGEKADELQQTLDQAQQAAQAIEENANEIQQKQTDGENSVLHYSELQKYLPESIDGYTAQEPEGNTAKMTGMQVSTIERAYTAEGGKGRIEITLVDYNEAVAGYMAATAAFAMDIEIENNESLVRTFKPGVPDTRGYENFNKVNGDAELLMGIGKRFFLAIKAEKQKGTELVKKIAASMPLDELATM